MLVLGGAMGAYDDADHPWLTDVKQLVRAAVADGMPVLGICLGHQLVAVALGGEVGAEPARPADRPARRRLDRRRRTTTRCWPASRPAPTRPPCSGTTTSSPRLPDGAVVLARTARGEVQAARFAPAGVGRAVAPRGRRGDHPALGRPRPRRRGRARASTSTPTRRRRRRPRPSCGAPGGRWPTRSPRVCREPAGATWPRR